MKIFWDNYSNNNNNNKKKKTIPKTLLCANISLPFVNRLQCLIFSVRYNQLSVLLVLSEYFISTFHIRDYVMNVVYIDINSAMGLQATAATKRKHELTFDTKDTNTYTANCPPPLKASKWSLNNNNYVDAVEEQCTSNKMSINGIKNCRTITTNDDIKTNCISPNNIHNNNNNNNNNESKNCDSSCGTIAHSIMNGKDINKPSTPVLNAIVATIPAAADVDATTPLPPTSITPVPEDSIAKLEVVAAVPCEPWVSAPEPVDCISKLQAVAVPTDPWGSISTRSTLATTLLSADELDDDDDDFEDDYEEEESIIPTYCPLRYHPFPTSSPSANAHQPQRIASFPPAQSYGSRPNYYSEPFPQQNCSRTGSPQHIRVANGFTWQNGGNGNFYGAHESFSAQQQQQQQPQQQQQTIRCAENGKSYLELGCSSPAPPPNSAPIVPQPTSFTNMHVNESRHPIKRCCDGRGSWCNTNKPCYKDIRLKIRNLSMFKLSRFRQVSEQSLYRSVLICNTLKRIDREIETEAKELHQAAANVAQQQQQHHQHQHSHYHHHLHSHMQHQPPPPPHLTHGGQHQQTPPQLHTQQQQPMLHPQHQDYIPVLNCGRLTGAIDYHGQHQVQQSHQLQQNFPHPYQQSQPERMDIPPPAYQKPAPNTHFTLGNGNSACNIGSATATMHPYDHYPFRESHSGRATPFPTCQPVISTPPATTPATTQVQSCQPANVTPAITTTTLTSLSDSDSGYADDDSTRSINWSSVLSLSSQSALDPLNNNDLFSILPPANPATAVPVTITSASSSVLNGNDNGNQTSSVAISGTFTTVQSANSSTSASSASTNNNCNTTPPSSSTTATFTTLSTISSATHSLTSSYVNSMSAHLNPASTWEYSFLDMEFGLGSEFTELVPSCKLSSSDDLFKNSLTPVAVTSRYENELEQPAHIMSNKTLHILLMCGERRKQFLFGMEIYCK
uniref:SERTA domain-containing protein n=1 Tax=Glossina brevipalpis TaxID=37001 RepID=A0A1A9WHP1_9MUSC